MKRLIACMFMLALLLGVFVPLAAQAPVESDSITDQQGCITVKESGDSLWRISSRVLHEPRLWEKVVEVNPFLQEKGRVTVNPENGWTYVHIEVGERVCNLDKLGLLPTLATPEELKQLGLAPTVTETTVTVQTIPTWLWWTLWLLVAAILLLFLRLRTARERAEGREQQEAELNRDPVNSGSPMVAGGLTPQNAEEHFRTLAATRFSEYDGRTWTTAANFIIERMVSGRGWGIMRVSYGNETAHDRRLRGDAVWQASVRYPDGTTELLYALQGCGNDLRGGYHNRPGEDFRFVADTVNQAVPPPAPAPAPNINEQGEFIRATDAPTVDNPAGVTFELKPPSEGKPTWLFTARGVVADDGFRVNLHDGQIEVRFNPDQGNKK